MTPEIQAGTVLGMILVLTSLMLGKVVLMIASWYLNHRNYRKGPFGIKHNEEGLCTKLHDWSLEITLAIRQLPAGPYNVCRKCGCIQGTHYKLNDHGINSLNESIKLRAKRTAERFKLEAKLEFDLESRRDRWINNNIKNIFDMCEEGNQEALTNNLEYLFRYAIQSQQEVIDKMRDEEDHQKQLEATYRKLGLSEDK